MNKLNESFKTTLSILLVVVSLSFIGCKKTDDPNNVGNGNNNENNGETPEMPAVVSSSEVQYNGKVYIESVFEDQTKMYFEILSPTEIALVNGEFYYQDSPCLAYIYRGDIVIPETITHFGTTYTVVSIAKKAFYRNEMVTSVYIPNSVTSIKMYSKGIYHGAFQGCTNLSNIHMSERIQDFGANSFADCPCYEQTVTIPKQVEKIGANAFSSKVVIFNADSCIIAGGENVPTNGSFNYSSAFPNMNSISFGANISLISSYICFITNIAVVDIPETVNTIGERAFANCENLKDISLPSSVKQINDWAFVGCPIETITCLANNPPVLGYNVFSSGSIQAIYVPMSSVDAYKTADGWSQYADVIVGI